MKIILNWLLSIYSFEANVHTTLYESIIGVRTNDLKIIAKEMIKDDYISFLEDLPHKYFEENQLHAFIIALINDYDLCIKYLNKFLPYIDNWATCDQLIIKIFNKNKDKLLKEIYKWIKSDKIYTVRFGISMLMKYYLDEDFKCEYLKLVSNIKSCEYYINMMISWYFQTALVKQYDSTIKYLTDRKLDVWIHNKTIQKCTESRMFNKEIKDYLKSLKIKK